MHTQKAFASKADAIDYLKREAGRYIAEYDMAGEGIGVRITYKDEMSRRITYEEDGSEVLMMVNELEVDM